MGAGTACRALLKRRYGNTSPPPAAAPPLQGRHWGCKTKRLPLRGKPAKRRQRRRKRAGFEEAARLAGPPGTGNRFAATVRLSAKRTERCHCLPRSPHCHCSSFQFVFGPIRARTAPVVPSSPAPPGLRRLLYGTSASARPPHPAPLEAPCCCHPALPLPAPPEMQLRCDIK